MARNGTVKQEAEPLDDLYDSLSLDRREVWDRIGAQGWKPVFQDGEWFATKGGQKTLGPVEDITALESLLPAADGSKTEDTADDHPDGVLFEEMRAKGQTVIPELRQPILNYEAFKQQRIEALQEELKWKKEVDRLMHQHKEMLAFDPETGIRSYRVGEFIEELVPGEDKLRSRKATEEDDQ